jgi:hypothetical protein
MNSPWGIILIQPPPAYRGGGSFDPLRFKIQSANLTWTWGSEPATASLVYVTDTPASIGAAVQLSIAGHTFYGLCKSDTPTVSSRGNTRSLEFADNREYLDWDRAYCAFNLPDDCVVDGLRVKRYAHILPRDFNASRKTYTAMPYSARQILDFLFCTPTTEDAWKRVYHPDQRQPLPVQFDFTSGESLRSAVQRVSDAQGLVFTLLGGPFRLVWVRKGGGTLPPIPAQTDDRQCGLTLSGNPTRIRVLGDRNLYQVHNIPVVPDWSPAWVQFFDPAKFIDHIYQVGTTRTDLTLTNNAGNTRTFPTGTPFKDIGTATQNSSAFDPEQMISRQLARALALEITVGQYAELVGDANFLDYRKFSTRCRNDMPAVLYIRQILFRAFRFPPGFFIVNAFGEQVPLHSMAPAQKMVAKVTHDPVSGLMEWDASQNADGSGYAIAKGYQVGRDLFRTIRPERFNLNQWTDAQNIWEHPEFQIDDSGAEDGFYFLFDDPVINSADLVKMVDGYGVFKANPTFTTPEVRVAVTFQAERFSYVRGRGTRDEVESVPGLNSEFASDFNGIEPLVEIPFSDGGLATEKADVIAASLLSRQFIYAKGSYIRWVTPGPNGKYPLGTQLTNMLDRISLEYSASGCLERCELTSERPRQTFVPERDLDRGARERALLPGQAELRHQANLARMTAAALRDSARARRTAADAFHGIFNCNDPTEIVVVSPGAGVDTYPVGTVLRREPIRVVANGNSVSVSNTQCVRPSVAARRHTEFAGVTVREGERVSTEGGELVVQKSGDILVRVKGPVKVGDAVGMVEAQPHLAREHYGDPVGRVLQEIPEAKEKLIRVRTSSAAAPQEATDPFQIVRVSDTTVKVGTGFLMTGFDAKAKARIWGLNKEFTVKQDHVIYLELVFDVNLALVLASVCSASRWDDDTFLRLIKSVRRSENAQELAELSGEFAAQADGSFKHVGLSSTENTANLGVATTALTAFANATGNVRCFKSFIVIGFATTGKGAVGIQLKDGATEFRVVQCLKHNLILAGFCDNGMPVVCPVPYAAPMIDCLPAVVASTFSDGITLAVPSHPDAKILYTLDGNEPNESSTLYTGKIGWQPAGTYLKSYATEEGYYDSGITTTQAWT